MPRGLMVQYIPKGKDEEMACQYYKMGEDLDKKAGIKPADPVAFVFKNKSVTIP
jgi:hypothetical protein